MQNEAILTPPSGAGAAAKGDLERASSAVAAPASLDWVRRLIEFDTTSRNSNMDLIDAVRAYLEQAGIEAVLTRDASGAYANLFATVPAADGRSSGGIVLSGHTDVVPVDGQDWDSDPFKPVIVGDKLFARGSCDMKGFIGAALTLLPRMQAARLSQPLHFALSFDEEVGCLGAPLMIEELQRRGVAPAGCIVGEPTSMRAVVAHKGINLYRCCVHGHAAHSSLTPHGVNAIEYAARLICHVRETAERFRKEGPFDEYFDVPFSTAQTSLIKGGNAVNTVPASCDFVFEYRNLPHVDPARIFASIEAFAREQLVPEMRAVVPSASIEFEQMCQAPGLLDDTEKDPEQASITQLVRALTADQQRRKVAYGTEAGLFQRAGIPAVVCGPGSIEQAHRANEFLELSQLAECERFLEKLIVSVSEPTTAA